MRSKKYTRRRGRKYNRSTRKHRKRNKYTRKTFRKYLKNIRSSKKKYSRRKYSRRHKLYGGQPVVHPFQWPLLEIRYYKGIKNPDRQTWPWKTWVDEKKDDAARSRMEGVTDLSEQIKKDKSYLKSHGGKDLIEWHQEHPSIRPSIPVLAERL